MGATYAPLDYVRQDTLNVDPSIPTIGFTSIPEFWESNCIPVFKELIGLTDIEIASLNYYDYMSYFLNIDFLNSSVKRDEVYTKINDYWISMIPELLSFYGYKESDLRKIASGKLQVDLQSEVRDAVVQGFIISDWASNKQVFKPDKTFAKYLLETDKLSLNIDYFKHLPVNTFYLDLSDNSDLFGNIHGVFVNVHLLNEIDVAVTYYILNDELVTFSAYNVMRLETAQTYETSNFDGDVTVSVIPNVKCETTNQTFNMRNISTIVLQTICYLNVSKPDIEDSPVTKNTYKKRNTVKNKFSELCIHDVGIRIGSTINHNLEEMKKAQHTSEKVYKSEDGIVIERKSPTPHIRCAHWHRFWHGSKQQGNRHLELQWVEPVFVCGSYTSNKDVIIHKMK